MASLRKREGPVSIEPEAIAATAGTNEQAAGGFKLHYAWIVSILTFFTLLIAAGVRTIPGVIIQPLEGEFGWSRGSISLGVGISFLAYGLGGPLGGSLVDRFGPRRVMVGGLALSALGLGPILLMTQLWQFDLLWGIVVGVGTGAIATVLGATVADRWFKSHRSLVVGLFSAASSAGQLVFLPALLALTDVSGWRSALGVSAIAISVLLLPVALWMRNRPEDLGLRRVGDNGEAAPVEKAPVKKVAGRSVTLREAARTRDFWLLASSFFICGFTSNGLVGTHLIPHAIEHGFTQVAAGGAIALMGSMNIVGTLASGWLSDRYDNRKLLAFYYGFRAVALLFLPLVFEIQFLLLFAVLYGLDWIATVPPTVNLTVQRFGRASLGKIFGWIFCSHMVGAAIAAYAGGFFHDLLGNYHLIFVTAALIGFMAVSLSLGISRRASVRVAQA